MSWPAIMAGMSDRLAKIEVMLAKTPQDAFLLYAAGLECKKAGRTVDALAYLGRALASDQKMYYAYFQKGEIHAARGEKAEARQVLQAGLSAATAGGDAKAAGEIESLMAEIE